MNLRAVLAIASLVLPPVVMTGAEAQAARPDTRAMTCEAARAFVRRNGAVVMTTGRHTYDRIVTGLGWCGPGEETELKTVPAADDAKCRIGYICRDRIDDKPFFWWRLH